MADDPATLGSGVYQSPFYADGRTINGELIRRLRKHAGLTQVDLGSILGASRCTIGEWESGKTKTIPYQGMRRAITNWAIKTQRTYGSPYQRLMVGDYLGDERVFMIIRQEPWTFSRFRDLLHQLRSYGITVTEMARAMDVHYTTFWYWFYTDRIPKPRRRATMIRFATIMTDHDNLVLDDVAAKAALAKESRRAQTSEGD